MERPTIALFGRPGDKQIVAVAKEVEAAGGTPIQLLLLMDESGAPAVSIGQNRMIWNGTDFSPIQAMYIRGTMPNTLPAMPPVMNSTMHAEWRTRYIREQEYQAFTYSFLSQLAAMGKLVINPLTTYVDHNSKAQFYEKMRALGFSFPRTLTTNDPAIASAFVREHKEVVVKPGIGVGSTRRLREDQLQRTEEFGRGPVTMQECINGKTVRVHVVGDTVVLSLKILTDEIDSRTATKGFEYTRLSDEEEAKLAKATRALGLHFAAWDVITSPDGKIYYLDCNPGPYVMWIGPQNVSAVFRQLAEYMIHFARSGSITEASARVKPYRLS
ncbi:MAG TPA: ATP-grasp domain-containing protein [Planctomycetota bacterium]|nr:ATP-grasp domain-containing protein [Planctomycetota bacterium]